ncbi:MAG: preprotein translocase subunit SecG, partial [FCB group bacterium]|nr:preprotein translocase subunit SecG [FCB group bacterium]
MIYGIFIVLHVLICIFMILVILMQASKGKGLAGAFGGAGGMASGILGARGTANFLSKATTYLAIAFFVNCIILSLLSRTMTDRRSALQDAVEYQSPA